nr:maleylpyruvate isomerase N-terminal domain-containing protein [uncultured Actinotalea sp.]
MTAPVADVLESEAAALAVALGRASEQDAGRATRCAPLTVAALLGHVRVTLRALGPMLAAPEPEREPRPAGPGVAVRVGAAEYYRPDGRFSPETDARRLAAAVAAGAEHPALPAQVAAWGAEVAVLLAAVRQGDRGEDRLVVTRHGDVMVLADFLVTRVLEVAVHGIDLADALGAPRWTTAAAATLLRALHLDGPLPEGVADDVAFLGLVTGRDPASPLQREALSRAGVRLLVLAG